MLARRVFAAAAIAAGCAVLAATPVGAQNFPSRPIVVIHPFTPGSATDVALRMICQKASEISGQPVLVENRPGGGGAVGAAALKNAKPDGYTLMQASQGVLAVAPNLALNPPYNSLKDFQPITQLWEAVSVLIVAANSPIKSATELAALAKQRQGGLNNATQGVGSSGHVVGAMAAKALGVPLTHVPYSGGAATKPDVLTGRVDMTFAIYGAFKADIEEGKAKVLAVSSRNRVSIWPNIPTMAEAGFPGVEYAEWFGLVGPAGMDPKIAETISDLFGRAVASPEVAEKLASTNGFVVKRSTPAEFGRQIATSYAEMKDLVNEMGIEKQ